MAYVVKNKKTNLFVCIQEDFDYNCCSETNDLEMATFFKFKDCTDMFFWTDIKKGQHHLVTLFERDIENHNINIDDYEILEVSIKLI